MATNRLAMAMNGVEWYGIGIVTRSIIAQQLNINKKESIA